MENSFVHFFLLESYENRNSAAVESTELQTLPLQSLKPLLQTFFRSSKFEIKTLLGVFWNALKTSKTNEKS